MAAELHRAAADAQDKLGSRLLAEEHRRIAMELTEQADDESDRAMNRNRNDRMTKARSLNEDRDPWSRRAKKAGY